MKFSAATPLYTSDTESWQIEQLPEVLTKLYSLGKPIVVFVHGRGKEPHKSLRGGSFTKGMAVHKIERGYNVSVLMFNWDSAFEGFNLFDREVPLSHTRAGGEALGKVLTGLKQFQADHLGRPSPALLVHSMGSIVIQQAIENGHWPEGPALFSNVLFSEPDADDLDHSTWLEPLAVRERTYLSQNSDDHVLKRSTDARPVGAKALGLGTSQPLAAHAKYVDLTGMGPLGKKDDDHEVFGKGAMNGQLYVCQFFTQALTGQAVILDSTINVTSIDRDVIYRLKQRHEPGAHCLQVPELP